MAKQRLVSGTPPASLQQQGMQPIMAAPLRGVPPARVFPDNWINVRNAGTLFTLQIKNGPQLVPAGTTRICNVETPDNYDFIVEEMVQAVWAATGPLAGVPRINWAIYCWMRPLAGQEMFSNCFVLLENLFGDGERPHVPARSFAIPASSLWEIQLRNEEAVDLVVDLEFRSARRVAIQDPAAFRFQG